MLDPVQCAILKFESHPSVHLIRNKITNGNNFKFEPVSLSDIELEMRLLNPKKQQHIKIFLRKY